ncbi:MAG TPA: SCO family protein [Streptosporangiaceae bacterium]|nr:SCO family protein [Streptosporangiaceae bacterium]
MTRATSALPPAGRPAGSPEEAPGTRRPGPIRRLVVALLCAAVLVAGLLAFLVVRHRAQQGVLAGIRPSGIPASVSTSTADLMQLSPVPATPAPGFTLTDQHGNILSLASFRGRPVVLEFMDPHCVDICPIVSQEFIDAYRDLGRSAAAVFIAVNVNPYYHSVANVTAYSREHQLTTIPSWHFFTGPLASLRSTWRAYGISVQAPSRNADVLHTSEVIFIDARGRERYVAAPMADYTAKGQAYLPAGPLTEWGQGIAQVARALGR